MSFVMNAEEKYAYDESISNFITIKIWNDLGIDVSNFSNFITDIGVSNNAGLEIFGDGMRKLFSEVQVLGYEERELLEEIVSECELEHTPECLYVFRNDKVQKIMESEQRENLFKFFSGQSGDMVEFQVTYHEKYGVLIAIYFWGLMFEVALSVAEIKTKIDRLYQQIEENSYGFYREAV